MEPQFSLTIVIWKNLIPQYQYVARLYWLVSDQQQANVAAPFVLILLLLFDH